MIRRSPVEAVLTSVVSTLAGSTGVSGLATGGVFNNVPQGTAYPYIEVTSPATSRVDTFSRFGADVPVAVKVVSQVKGDQAPARIHNACIVALGGEGGSNVLTLAAPHRSLGITWDNDDRYAETVNGITTRYHVGMFRVWTEQTS